MKSKAQLWAELVNANGNLVAYAQDLDTNAVRSIALERELNVNPAFFAGHLERALEHLAPHQRQTWLSNVMTGDQGFINEAYAYGTLAEREFNFTPVATVPSASLYRTSDETTDLDSSFPHIGVNFDVKSLSHPGGILESLLDVVNARISAINKIAFANGSLDFDQTHLGGAAFGQAVQTISAASEQQNSYVHPDLQLTFRFSDLSEKFQLAEETFHPFRFAQENRHLVVTNAKQVPRAGRFLFIYVYSQLDHKLAAFPQHSHNGERALARRVFFELIQDATNAIRYCVDADPAVTVGQIARSIGGLAFVCVRQRDSASDISFYLNPNANVGQEITAEHVEQMSDFGNGFAVDDFLFDNY